MNSLTVFDFNGNLKQSDTNPSISGKETVRILKLAAAF